MTPVETIHLVDDLVWSWNEHDVEAFSKHLTDDVVWSDPAMPLPAQGLAAVRTFASSVLAAFPDVTYAVRGPVCITPDGSRCAVPWTMTGTHSKPLVPPGLAPTNTSVRFHGVDLLEFRGDKVSRIETYFDPTVPAEQLLGLTLRPPPGSFWERVFVLVQRVVAAFVRFRARRPKREG